MVNSEIAIIIFVKYKYFLRMHKASPSGNTTAETLDYMEVMKMKKMICLALSLVLCAAVLAGCRSNNQPMETTRPEPMPSTAPTTMPPATMPSETTLPTTGTIPSETMDRGNGPLDATDSTTSTGGTAPQGESRNISPMPNGR